MAWQYKELFGYFAVAQADKDLSPAITDPQAAADALNLQTDPITPGPIDILDVTTFLRNAGRVDGTTAWLAIVSAAASGNIAAKAAIDYNSDPRTKNIDLYSPVVTAMLAALVASNVITQAECDGLLAIVPTTIIRWVPKLTDNDIIAARNLS